MLLIKFEAKPIDRSNKFRLEYAYILSDSDTILVFTYLNGRDNPIRTFNVDCGRWEDGKVDYHYMGSSINVDGKTFPKVVAAPIGMFKDPCLDILRVDSRIADLLISFIDSKLGKSDIEKAVAREGWQMNFKLDNQSYIGGWRCSNSSGDTRPVSCFILDIMNQTEVKRELLKPVD